MLEESIVRVPRGNEYYYMTVNGEYVSFEKKCNKLSVEIVEAQEESTLIFSMEVIIKLAKVINIMFGAAIDEIKVYHVVRESSILENKQEIDIKSLI